MFFSTLSPTFCFLATLRGNETVKVAGCTIVQDNPDIVPYMTYVRPWQDFIVRSAGPFAVLLVCNCFIIGKLIQQAAKRSKMTGGGSDSDSDMKSITAMLLTVSFAHLVSIYIYRWCYLVTIIISTHTH